MLSRNSDLSTDAYQNKDQQVFTPPELAKRWRVSSDKVRNFIATGELVAFNVANKQSGRPRYRISIEEVRKFEARRATPPKPQVKRKMKKPQGIIEFF